MAETYDVYFGTSPSVLVLIAEGVSDLSVAVPGLPLQYGATYYWRVDATNEIGTTTGDVWSFATLAYDPPMTSWTNLPGKTLGPLRVGGAGPGVEGVDFYYTGTNFGSSVRRLVAAANDAIWYEDIGG